MMQTGTHLPYKPVAVRLLTTLLVAASIVGLNACNSGGDTAQAPLAAACDATMATDRSITLPAVQTAAGTFQLTLVPAPTPEDPGQYLGTRQPVDASQLGCLPVQLNGQSAGVLRAEGIRRFGQVVSVTFMERAGTNSFVKISGSASGLLDGDAGELTPVVRGSVVVTNTAGAVLATGKTNDYGALIVWSAALPDSFRVAVSGGTMSGAPFLGSLKAEIENYTTVEDAVLVTLTPVTTLVAAYHERYPSLTLNESMARVKEQLGMPQRMDIDADDQSSSEYFDSAVFYAAAQAAGGVDALVQQVLDDWEAGTEHAFAPAAAVDVQLPSLLMKALLPARDLPNFKCVEQPCGETPMAAADAISLIGKGYSIYRGLQTADYQASTLNTLRSIKAEVTQISNLLEKVLADLNDTAYKNSRTLIDPPYNKDLNPYNPTQLAIKAYEGLVYIATRPDSDFALPANCPIATENESCKALRDHVVAKAGYLKAINTLIDSQNVLRNQPMVRFRDALSGEPGSTGMFRNYRALVLDRSTSKAVGVPARLFFTPDDSKLIWDHYRYWQSIQALVYFFIADEYTATGRTGPDSVFEKFKAEYDAALAAEKAAMPMRTLPKGTYIDPHNLDFAGNRVGGPLMWLPSPKTLCNIVGPVEFAFNTNNAVKQPAITSYMNCVNTDAYSGHGLRDWKLPTLSEWKAFTQTSGLPNAIAMGLPGVTSVGDWMAYRGAEDARHLNGLAVYATFKDLCIGASGTPLCSAGDYSWTASTNNTIFPWIRFNIDHRVQAYALNGIRGAAVIPVRKINVDEYY